MAEAWDEVTSVEWERELMRQQWQARRDGNGKLLAYTLHVACPRCLHEKAIDLEHDVKPLLDRDGPPPLIHANIYAECQCTDEHPGRPAGETGCGARATIEFNIPAGAGQ